MFFYYLTGLALLGTYVFEPFETLVRMGGAPFGVSVKYLWAIYGQRVYIIFFLIGSLIVETLGAPGFVSFLALGFLFVLSVSEIRTDIANRPTKVQAESNLYIGRGVAQIVFSLCVLLLRFL